MKRRFCKRMIIAALVAVAVGGGTMAVLAKGGNSKRRAAARSSVDQHYRVVFFSVLEGLYDDGVSNKTVDLVIRQDPTTGGAMHFVPGCPLCMPALDAFRAYRRRPGFSMKGTGDTFGSGLEPELLSEFKSEQMEDRVEAVYVLVQRYVRRRLDEMRLTSDERRRWLRGMAERRKKGMYMLKVLQEAGTAGAFTGMKRCGVCDAARGACEEK